MALIIDYFYWLTFDIFHWIVAAIDEPEDCENATSDGQSQDDR